MFFISKQMEELKKMGDLMKNLQEQLKNAEQEKQDLRKQMEQMSTTPVSQPDPVL